LILSKIVKIVATKCHILRLKCTKFDFGWGSAPDPALGELTAPPDPQAGFKGEGGRVRMRGKGFSSYLSIHWLGKGPGKYLVGVLEKCWIFVSKRVGTLVSADVKR